jgi:antitoxin Phd
MEKNFSIAEAKNRLPAIVHLVEEGQAVRLTRHGKPVAVMLSIQDYEKMNKSKGDFWRALMAFRSSLDQEGIEIDDSDFEALRDQTTGREVSWS